ncbi:hypothetical protein J6590_052100 [Homalodisca vitripennis]|nr:hypothetical protein J6590_052100 [Homalodisca vitripennis]
MAMSGECVRAQRPHASAVAHARSTISLSIAHVSITDREWRVCRWRHTHSFSSDNLGYTNTRLFIQVSSHSTDHFTWKSSILGIQSQAYCNLPRGITYRSFLNNQRT